MGTQLNTFHLVEAPAAVPYRFGLFSQVAPRVANAVGVSADEHWRLGVNWVSEACATAKITTGACIDDEVGPLTPDDYCSVSEFDPFTVYAYNNGDVPGFTLAEATQNAVARLTNGEQTAAESHLWDLMASATSGNVTDLSAYDLLYGLGYVEQVLAEKYGGQGVIHMSRLAATMLTHDLHVEGGRLFTVMGTPVVAGGGYDAIGDDVPNTGLIFGSGPLVLYRGDVDTNQSAVDKSNNQVSIVAQRDYVLGWDCLVVAAEVTLTNVEGA